MEQMRSHIKQIHLNERRVAMGVSPAKAKDIEAAKNVEPVVPTPVVLPPVEEKPKRKPIELQYMYTGQCEVDGLPIKTIPIKAGGNLYMVAFCNNCDKQYQSIQVVPIDQMRGKLMEDEAEEEAIDEVKGVWPINKFRKSK